jgi:hypothetical protein
MISNNKLYYLITDFIPIAAQMITKTDSIVDKIVRKHALDYFHAPSYSILNKIFL